LPVRKEPVGLRIKCTCSEPQASQAPTLLKGGRSMMVRPNSL
jgi:hypothetical protein